jgi:hypothetical protein
LFINEGFSPILRDDGQPRLHPGGVLKLSETKKEMTIGVGAYQVALCKNQTMGYAQLPLQSIGARMKDDEQKRIEGFQDLIQQAYGNVRDRQFLEMISSIDFELIRKQHLYIFCSVDHDGMRIFTIPYMSAFETRVDSLKKSVSSRYPIFINLPEPDTLPLRQVYNIHALTIADQNLAPDGAGIEAVLKDIIPVVNTLYQEDLEDVLDKRKAKKEYDRFMRRIQEEAMARIPQLRELVQKNGLGT